VWTCTCREAGIQCGHVHVGKHVFKKSVKLVVTVSPTHATAPGPHHPDTTGVVTEAGEHTGPSLGDSIIFDGRTFTVTFSHSSGEFLKYPE